LILEVSISRHRLTIWDVSVVRKLIPKVKEIEGVTERINLLV